MLSFFASLFSMESIASDVNLSCFIDLRRQVLIKFYLLKLYSQLTTVTGIFSNMCCAIQRFVKGLFCQFFLLHCLLLRMTDNVLLAAFWFCSHNLSKIVSSYQTDLRSSLNSSSPFISEMFFTVRCLCNILQSSLSLSFGGSFFNVK